jgi:hypothetical protein
MHNIILDLQAYADLKRSAELPSNSNSDLILILILIQILF